MPIPSTVDTLPPEIRAEIDRMLMRKLPLDDIISYLWTTVRAETPEIVTSPELPAQIVSEIRRLLIQQVPVDRIVAYLRAMSGATTIAEADLPSRSALGRYAVRTAALRDRLAKSRAMAAAIAAEIGEAPGSTQTALLAELLQTSIFEFMVPDDGEVDLTPKAIGEMAKALKDITTALRGNVAFIREAEKLAADKATATAAAKLAATLATAEGEAAASLAPQTPEQIIGRIRALYAGEG